jgi:NADH-quinone oxidoreductase subunit C
MQENEIFEKLKAEFGDAVIEQVIAPPSETFIKISADKVFDICVYLRDHSQMLFDYLSCLSGMDEKENLGVVYHLYSIPFGHRITLKCSVPKDNPIVPTVERVWRTADWHERECWDLIGVKFEGHLNLIRILCGYDWEGHPLRKDYVQPEEYHGFKVPY